MARRIVQRLTVASATVDEADIGPGTISTPISEGGAKLKQHVPDRVTAPAGAFILLLYGPM